MQEIRPVSAALPAGTPRENAPHSLHSYSPCPTTHTAADIARFMLGSSHYFRDRRRAGDFGARTTIAARLANHVVRRFLHAFAEMDRAGGGQPWWL